MLNVVANHARRAFRVDLDEVDDAGRIVKPTGPKGTVKRLLNQGCRAATTRGLWLPVVQASAPACRTYWESRVTGEPNAPDDYAGKDTRIVDVLDAAWRPEVDERASVLELGANAGANLARLNALGYEDLSAVEINPAAVATMRRSFPQLAGTTVAIGSLESVLPTLPGSSFDVVFTMAVLIHVHPSSHDVFDHMARIARRFVCVVEHETVANTYVFPRDYRRLFGRLGFREVRSQRITRQDSPELIDYHGYTIRLLAKGALNRQDPA